MAKAGMGQRVAAIVLAILFLVTSVGFSGLVIWQIHQDNKQQDNQQQDNQQQDNQQNTSQNSSEVSTDNSTETQTKKEGTLEGTQLADFTPIAKVDGLQKIDTQVGTGEEVKSGDTVTAHYTGAIAATGRIFQSSHDGGQPIPFSLTQVIKGWTDGVPGMKVGGKRRLLIPADQAYGANPPAGSNIPANADLVFDIELVKIGQ